VHQFRHWPAHRLSVCGLLRAAIGGVVVGELIYRRTSPLPCRALVDLSSSPARRVVVSRARCREIVIPSLARHADASRTLRPLAVS